MKGAFAMSKSRSLNDGALMTAPERELFERTLAAGVRRYMEFGAGGSTLLALRAGASDLVVVESDPTWIAAVAEHPEAAAAIAEHRLALLGADIGPTREFGYPAAMDAPAARWSRYVQVGWAEWARRGTRPDLVFVDGRFRVACCLSVLLACSDSPVRVLVHDICPERPGYAAILSCYDVIMQSGTLYQLAPRPHLSAAGVLSALLEAQFDPR
jgi:hypothetical protein